MKVKVKLTDSDIAMVITGLMRNIFEYEKDYEKDYEKLLKSKEFPTVKKIKKRQIKQANKLIDYLDRELKGQNQKIRKK